MMSNQRGAAAGRFSMAEGRRWRTPFFTIWGGQALSILGSQLVQFSLIWYLTVETGSATVLATASLVGTLPQVVLGPFVGTLVDRWDRRRTMVVADLFVSAATVALAILFAMDAAAIWNIYVVMLIRSLSGCFHGNAMNVSTSLMVPVEHLTRIQGLNQMLNGGLNVVAAPLGALLLGFLPLQGILAIDVCTAVIAIVPLLWISVPQPDRSEKAGIGRARVSTVWQDFRAGFRYFASHRGLVIVGLMTVGINFTVIPAFSLLPLLVKTTFGGDAVQLGWVESAMGIGTIAGGLVLGVWGGFRRKILTSMMGLVGMGIGALTIGLAPASALPMALGGVLLVGAMNSVTMGPFFAVIQSAVEPDMQARVLTLLSSVGGGMAPLGLMVAGPVADRVGIQAWFLVGGVVCAVMGISGCFVPALKSVEDGGGEPLEPHAKGAAVAL